MGYRMEWKCDHCGTTEFTRNHRDPSRIPERWEAHEVEVLDIFGNEWEYISVSFCKKCNDQWLAIKAANELAWKKTVHDFINR